MVALTSRAPLSAWISATLLVAGSALFVTGGAQHPKAGSAFGTVGSDAFYRAFASHIASDPSWIAVHALILIGPLLWALGVPRRLPGPVSGAELTATSAFEGLASRALLLGAALWAVTFVLDGLVAPQTARAIALASPGDASHLIPTFQANQSTVVRLGLVSWVLIGLATALYGTAMLARAGGVSGRAVLGATGVVLGLWPIVATVTGEFDPGPFTSSLWNVTALSSALWFAALGVHLLVRSRDAVVRVPGTSPRSIEQG